MGHRREFPLFRNATHSRADATAFEVGRHAEIAQSAAVASEGEGTARMRDAAAGYIVKEEYRRGRAVDQLATRANAVRIGVVTSHGLVWIRHFVAMIRPDCRMIFMRRRTRPSLGYAPWRASVATLDINSMHCPFPGLIPFPLRRFISSRT